MPNSRHFVLEHGPTYFYFIFFVSCFAIPIFLHRQRRLYANGYGCTEIACVSLYWCVTLAKVIWSANLTDDDDGEEEEEGKKYLFYADTDTNAMLTTMTASNDDGGGVNGYGYVCDDDWWWLMIT